MLQDPAFRDQPIDRASGVSLHRERLWGLVGGLVGSLAGIGSFGVAWLVPGASMREMAGSPYPPLLARRETIALDFYFLAIVLLGMAFLISALVLVRRGRYPRTDGYGALFMGGLLAVLGGVILFVRVWAITHG